MDNKHWIQNLSHDVDKWLADPSVETSIKVDAIRFVHEWVKTAKPGAKLMLTMGVAKNEGVAP